MNMKQFIAPAAALAVAAAVLLGVSAALGGTARSSGEAARNEIMSYMLPGRPASFTEEIYDGEDESIRRVFKAEDGYVLEVEADGYVGPMTLWVGVTNDGTVSGVTVRDHGETFGLGRGLRPTPPFCCNFWAPPGRPLWERTSTPSPGPPSPARR